MFNIQLTGTGLSRFTDTDGDGLNDAAEFQMQALGFDWQTGQTQLVQTYFSAAQTGGLYSRDQFQALKMAAPLIAKDAVTGQFSLTLGLAKSTDLSLFSPLPVAPSQISVNADGKLVFKFAPTDRAAFYRIEGK